MQFRRTFPLAAVIAALVLPALPLSAQWPSTEKLDLDAIYRIKEEGLQRSKVMEIESYLTDVYGPRLTGSPNMKEAGDWAMKTMKDWGLANVHAEAWAFGRGWQNQRFTANAVTPRAYPLIAYPKAWTPGTNGPVTGDAVIAVINEDKDFADVQGQAARQVRARPGDARRARALRGAGTPLYRRRARRPGQAAAGRRPRRARQFRCSPGVQPQEGRVLHRRRRRGRARLQPRRRRYGVRAGAAGRVARSERTGAAAAGDADRRTLRPHLADAGEEDPGHPADRCRQQVLRRRPQLLQHRRRAAGHRQGGRDRDARRALRFVAHRHGRDGQRRRLRGDDGSDAAAQGQRRQAAAHGAHRTVGRRGGRAARLEGIRQGPLRRSGDDGAEAGAREARRLLQRRQRDRTDPRRLPAGERSGRRRSSSSGWSRSRTSG